MNATKRYKDIDLPFICPISNRSFDSTKGLSVYISKSLKQDHKEYYDKYINHRDRSCFFCGGEGKFISVGKGYRNLCEEEECVKKSFNSHSIEGIMYREMCSREEAEIKFNIENSRQLEERMKTFSKLREGNPNFDKERNQLCEEYWIKRGFTDEESSKKIEEIRKNIVQKSSKTIKNNPEKYASKYPTKIEYYLSRGYSEEEGRKIIKEIQNRFSLNKCIEKYGIEGQKIWKDRQEKWKRSLNSKTEQEKIEINRKKLFNNSGYSKISQKLFWNIYEKFSENNIKFEELTGELVLYNKDLNKHYRYDYVDFTRKKIIEFNGDFWHCNPEKYNEDFNHKILKSSAKKIWMNDKIKIDWISSKGYKVMVIWESEYRKDPKQTLEKCIEFINEK